MAHYVEPIVFSKVSKVSLEVQDKDMPAIPEDANTIVEEAKISLRLKKKVNSDDISSKELVQDQERGGDNVQKEKGISLKIFFGSKY